ncbi:MAG: membrane protein insertion efficiency factor YidD [Burkholderiaceae bacterium]|nr:membrane protein insertion efficiency factor YidD [Burkholderiaceae bacterium]
MLKLIRGYQYFLSPWLGQSCRFTPSCSNYSLEAIRIWGPVKGGWLSIKRIGRCNPWCRGGHDPVPSLKSKA